MSFDSTVPPSSEITDPMRENPRCSPSLLFTDVLSPTLVDEEIGDTLFKPFAEELMAPVKIPFMCPYCIFSSECLCNLEMHIETHNKVDQAVDSDKVNPYLISPFAEAPMAPVEGPFKCPHCTFSSARKHDLKTHVKVHNYVAEKRFGCHICERHFSRKHDLRRHHERHRMSSSSASSVSCRRFDLRPDPCQYRPLLSLHLEANRLRRHFFRAHYLPPMRL